MAHGINFNSHDLSSYLRIQWPDDMLQRIPDILQAQDRAWASKGKGGPRTMSIPVKIIGTSLATLNTYIETVRGYLDEEDDCVLTIDGIDSRYWMARFESLTGKYISDKVWQGTITFVCHDRKGYSTSTYSQQETLASNVSASYGGTIRAMAIDEDDPDIIYIGGGTTQKVYALSAIDLTKIAESADYGGEIWTICAPTGDYIYVGGATTLKVNQLNKSDLSLNAQSPSYGAATTIISITHYGNYIYYGGDGGAGQYDIVKLDKATMAVELRSVDYGGIIYAVCANGTHVFAAGGTTQRVRRYLISDLTYVDQSDDYTAVIRAMTLNEAGTTCYWCGELDEIWYAAVGDLTTETQSVDLGTDLYGIAVDDDYIYAVGFDEVVYKLDIAFAGGASYIAKSAGYGGTLYACAINATDGFLYIGGATTRTAWKLDTRQLVLNSQSSVCGDGLPFGRAICVYGDFIYTAGSWGALPSARLLKLNKLTLEIVATSIVYGNAIYAICADDDFVYIGGEQVGGAAVTAMWKLTADDLTFVISGPVYGGNIGCACCSASEDYIYYGGDGGAGQYDMCQLQKDDFTTIARSVDYGGVILCCCQSGTYIFYGGSGGAGQYDMCKLDKTAFGAAPTRTADYGGMILGCDTDGTYIYYGGANTNAVRKTDIATMAASTTSASLGGTVYAVSCDATYNYACTQTTQRVYKLLNSDMSLVAYTAAYSSLMYMLETDDGYIYARNGDDYCIDKIDKRVLWTRADHEITIAYTGTGRCDPVFGLIANGVNYWQQSFENQTTDQTWLWEGTQGDGEELEVDSVLWYCTLEGDSAMSGVSGSWIQLAPGSNVLYLENVIGEFIIDWRPRYA